MIKISNVTKKYDKTVVLENLSYDFHNNGITCLLGASGCGKTTLLNLLAGFDSDYSGNIMVNGIDIGQLSASELGKYRKNNIGFIFQNYNLISGYSVMENILLAAQLNNQSEEDNFKQALDLINKLGIGVKADEKVENLSGGQKQRVAIARALIGNARILFADEPTGALDRSTANEIMELLKELSKDHLIVVITHDRKICDYANEVISIIDSKIEIIKEDVTQKSDKIEKVVIKDHKPNIIKRAARNFKNHLGRYIAVAIALAIGISAFSFSLSSQNIIDSSIEKFKEKNTSFQNGFVALKEDGLDPTPYLKDDERTQHIYYQYVMKDVDLSINGKQVHLDKKIPISMSGENMVIGIMPRYGQNEIVLSPSVAKKINDNIEELVGKDINITFNNQSIKVKISGIFNAMYDDFILSLDSENKLYQNIKDQKAFSVVYDVKEFTDVMPVTLMLKDRGFMAETAANEVDSLQKTFNNLKTLFMVVSIFILSIGLFISVLLLFKLMNARYREVGLMSALGYSRSQISRILISENLMLSALAVVSNLVVIILVIIIGKYGFSIEVLLKPMQIGMSVIATFVVVTTISGVASIKLICTQPATALRK
ncbi:MAG: ABC transporter ATP-binding protein/permease [Erysipelotrichaceae bacterium]